MTSMCHAPHIADMLEMTAECGNPPASTSASRKVGVTLSWEVCGACKVSPAHPSHPGCHREDY